uniref:ISXO2-like transposase domain-containing protein n=1 Tax=Amphimedon queenslandica TaxID=400682 RepID=A0A1X7TU20_AMPQE
MVTVQDRSAATLIPLIKKYILPGTKVISDCWKSYSTLQQEGYIHGTVNHSIEFVNSETGDHYRKHLEGS